LARGKGVHKEKTVLKNRIVNEERQTVGGSAGERDSKSGRREVIFSQMRLRLQARKERKQRD